MAAYPHGRGIGSSDLFTQMRLAESGGGKRETLKLKPEVIDPANYAGEGQDTREAGMAKKPYIIALEEHYQDPEVK
jgi:hypothetical protein